MSADAPSTTGTTGNPVEVAPVNTQPFYTDWLKPDGSFNAASYDRLPEDVRYVKDTLSKYRNPEELVRGIAHLQTLGGKKGLIPLPANAPKDAIAERKSLLDSINGVPKEAKDYGMSRPQEWPEDHWNGKMVENLTTWAHKNSINPAALKELTDTQLGSLKEQLAQSAQQEQLAIASHDAEFSKQAALDRIPLDRAKALAERGATALGLDLNNPEHATLFKIASVKMMALRHAQATGEDKFVAGEAAKGEGGDAEALYNDAMHNPANPLYGPLYDPGHPQHAQAKEKVRGWVRVATERRQAATQRR